MPRGRRGRLVRPCPPWRDEVFHGDSGNRINRWFRNRRSGGVSRNPSAGTSPDTSATVAPALSAGDRVMLLPSTCWVERLGGTFLLMKRRTLRPLRLSARTEDHHHVYVVRLDPAVARLKKVRAANPDRDPKKPCVYVGMTGLRPEERFANHKSGIKSAFVVRRYGRELMPELYEHLNPMPFEAAAQMEMDLAEDLRRAGYTVTGGH